MGLDAMILVFWKFSFKPTFLLSSFTFIKRLFSYLISFWNSEYFTIKRRVTLASENTPKDFAHAINFENCAWNMKHKHKTTADNSQITKWINEFTCVVLKATWKLHWMHLFKSALMCKCFSKHSIHWLDCRFRSIKTKMLLMEKN